MDKEWVNDLTYDELELYEEGYRDAVKHSIEIIRESADKYGDKSIGELRQPLVWAFREKMKQLHTPEEANQ